MSEEIITVWKATRANGQPTHGTSSLPQPENGRPGDWHDVGRDPIPCRVGVHGCRTLVGILGGGWLHEELYVAELRGPIVDEANKVVGRSGRLCYRVEAWNEQTARLFAADCAELVAHLHPIIEPTVRVVRRYAFGLDSTAALDAAEAAAWAAARAAAWAAARLAAVGAVCTAGDAAYERMALRLHDYLAGKVDIEAIRESVE